MDEVNETPQVSWWTIMLMNWQSRLWAVEHWVITHPIGLHFCPSCSGYFREACMTLPDMCEACYARSYGVPVAQESPAFALSALGEYVQDYSEVRATCACGQPIAVMQIKHDYDDKEAHAFFAGAFLGHLDAEGARENPQGHGLNLSVVDRI